MEPALTITSPDITDGGRMQEKNTADGADVSPALILNGISPDAVSLAVTMYDNDVPVLGRLCHWLIWDMPVDEAIPAAIPAGGHVAGLGFAVQGKAYGKSCYRGPNIPRFLKNTHRYTFTVYVLDKLLKLPPTAGDGEFIKAVQGHILQTAAITGTYSNKKK